jgi:hypothetical protein
MERHELDRDHAGHDDLLHELGAIGVGVVHITTACTAVGDAGGCCGAFGAVAMSWDGTAWSTSELSLSAQVYFDGVSCPVATACLTAGGTSPNDSQSFPPAPAVERSDGTSWTGVPVSLPSFQGGLNDVACTRPGWCAAVGSFETRAGMLPLVERWNGNAFARMWTPA